MGRVSPRRAGRSVAHAAEGGEAKVFVQDVDAPEAHLPQRIELIQQGPGGILPVDVGHHVVAVGHVLEAGQVVAVAPPEQPLIAGIELSTRSNTQSEPPGRSARWKAAKTLRHSESSRRWCSIAATSTTSNAPSGSSIS